MLTVCLSEPMLYLSYLLLLGLNELTLSVGASVGDGVVLENLYLDGETRGLYLYLGSAVTSLFSVEPSSFSRCLDFESVLFLFGSPASGALVEVIFRRSL